MGKKKRSSFRAQSDKGDPEMRDLLKRIEASDVDPAQSYTTPPRAFGRGHSGFPCVFCGASSKAQNTRDCLPSRMVLTKREKV